jgi:hypothetical protein
VETQGGPASTVVVPFTPEPVSPVQRPVLVSHVSVRELMQSPELWHGYQQKPCPFLYEMQSSPAPQSELLLQSCVQNGVGFPF